MVVKIMNYTDLKIGDKYSLKPSSKGKCNNIDTALTAYPKGYIVLTQIDDDGDEDLHYSIYSEFGEIQHACNGCITHNDLEPYKANGKTLKVAYIATWDNTSRDPYKVFCSRVDLVEWLVKMHEDRTIIWSTIKIYRVSKTLSVKTEIGLSGE
jgi:hypothetical protein